MSSKTQRELFSDLIDQRQALEKAAAMSAFDAACASVLASVQPLARKPYTRKPKAKPADVLAEGGEA